MAGIWVSTSELMSNTLIRTHVWVFVWLSAFISPGCISRARIPGSDQAVFNSLRHFWIPWKQPWMCDVPFPAVVETSHVPMSSLGHISVWRVGPWLWSTVSPSPVSRFLSNNVLCTSSNVLTGFCFQCWAAGNHCGFWMQVPYQICDLKYLYISLLWPCCAGLSSKPKCHRLQEFIWAYLQKSLAVGLLASYLPS